MTARSDYNASVTSAQSAWRARNVVAEAVFRASFGAHSDEVGRGFRAKAATHSN